MPNENSQAGYAANELLIKFKPSIQNPGNNPLAQAIINRVQARLQERLGNSNWVRVKLPEDQTLQQAMSQLRAQADVEYAEPNYILHANVIPNDPEFNRLWGLHNTGQSGKTDTDIDAPEAWDRFNPSGNTVVVAVIDSGADFQHPDLSGRIWNNAKETAGNGQDDDRNGYVDDTHGWDFANNDNNPTDDNSHGTHVAGTIAATANNGRGVVGVAGPANVKIMPLKFLDANGSGLTSNAIKALDYATANGAVISNNSWGGANYSKALYDAIVRNQNAGRVFVASAGNNAQNTDSSPQYPQSYDVPNILSVAAATSSDALSSFSNYGKQSVDLAAPGSSIYSTVNGGGYASKSGTSMAAPHVAGAAALLWAHNKSLTHLQIKNILMNSVRKAGYLEHTTVSGGMLNLEKAMIAIGAGSTPTPQPTPQPSPTPSDKPAMPTHLTGQPSGRTTGGTTRRSVKIGWRDNATNETGQEIWISTDGLNYRSLVRLGANVTTYTHEIGTAMSSDLYYKVRAYNGAGFSSFSSGLRVRKF